MKVHASVPVTRVSSPTRQRTVSWSHNPTMNVPIENWGIGDYEILVRNVNLGFAGLDRACGILQ